VESNPSEVIFWERNINCGITADINKNRFKNTMTIQANQKSVSDRGTPYDGISSVIDNFSQQTMISAALLFQPPQGCFEPFNKENNTTLVINSKDNDNNVAIIVEDSRNELSKEERKEEKEENEEKEELEKKNSPEPNNDLFRKEVIKHFLSDGALTLETLFLVDDDDEVDPSGTIHALRNIFEEVCPFGDALILARQNPWHTMNKTILNEFKSQWEKAIMVVKKEEMDGYLSDPTWLQAMWLYIIGFPLSVRTKRDVIVALFLAFSKLTSFSQEDIISALTFKGFRPSLSHWICDRCCLNSLKEDVLGVATYMPWNSYLCSVDGDVHYTHLHSDNEGLDYNAVQPVKVVLNVENTTRKNIKAVQLEMELENWTPKDFVKSTFHKLQDMMKGQPDSYYILGHCCPEQALVSMGKSSISPLATYRNKFSCGHGMYFFKLDHAVLQLSFDGLHKMAHEKSHEKSQALNPLGLQFRAFLYAMLTVFQKPECDALSLSVLVFLSSYEFQPFDSSLKALPLCNDDAPEGWKCSCKSPLSSISMDGVVSDKSWPLTTSAICAAISMINREDIEKINAFALLGGIVDFDRISTGVYSSIIMDNNLEYVTESFKNIPEWSTDSKFDVWKGLVNRKSSCFRRSTTSFNHEGGFSLTKPDNQLKNKPQQWSDCPLDPIREIVFVHSSALSKLLTEAHHVFVVF
jgi:hypothetical protein